jgi:hypothetical protein
MPQTPDADLTPAPRWTSSLEDARALVVRVQSSALYEDALRELNGWTSGLFTAPARAESTIVSTSHARSQLDLSF